ncbi:MAG TPA: chemotaxis protein CheB [Cytophagaceae bacterium]|jgi:two-component system chemotaxis response regulator CheB|nr:chemotaxis protein CheB [Cytophagaceae bacterium]
MRASDISRPYKAIVIGGSAGSFTVLANILSKIPKDFSLPIIICCHRLKHVRSGFIEALEIKSVKKVVEPDDKESIKKGKVYVAPANYHLCIELGNTFALSTESMVNNSRPAIDITLETAAYVYKEKLVSILLTGANKDGALGMKSVKEYGGLTIVQEPTECTIDTMPKAAMAATKIDYVMKVEEIIKFLNDLHKSQTT